MDPLTPPHPLLKMLRLPYLPVVLGPLYLGFVMAGRRLLPEATAGAVGRFALAATALGPLLWCGTLLFNDACDFAVDGANPRRCRTPLQRGAIGRREVLLWAVGMKALALALALRVSPGFFLALLLFAGLSWLYSAEPFRLKARPGFDVLVNAVGIGALCTLAGWAVLRPLAAFPGWFLLPLLLGWASLYIPTTIVDEPADRSAGVTTFAVRFGNRAAFRASLAAMVLSVLLIYGMALAGYVLSRAIIPWTAPLAVLQVGLFAHHGRHWHRPERVYRGVVWAAVLGVLMECLVVLDLAGVIGAGLPPVPG